MAFIKIGNDSELTLSNLMEQFKKHFENKYEVYIQKPTDHYFIVKQDSMSAVAISLFQKKGKTLIHYSRFTPSTFARFFFKSFVLIFFGGNVLKDVDIYLQSFKKDEKNNFPNESLSAGEVYKSRILTSSSFAIATLISVILIYFLGFEKELTTSTTIPWIVWILCAAIIGFTINLENVPPLEDKWFFQGISIGFSSGILIIILKAIVLTVFLFFGIFEPPDEHMVQTPLGFVLLFFLLLIADIIGEGGLSLIVYMIVTAISMKIYYKKFN